MDYINRSSIDRNYFIGVIGFNVKDVYITARYSYLEPFLVASEFKEKDDCSQLNEMDN